MIPDTKPRERRGSALLLVLIAMVVLAVLASASMVSSLQEVRSSRAAQLQQRALTVAEFGLNSQLDSWPSTRNAMATGAIDSTAVGVALGDTAIVRVQRLNGSDYQVVSIGRAGVGNGLLEAQRQVSMLVKASAPLFIPAGVITSFNDIDVQGASFISGRNVAPPTWTDCNVSGGDTTAVSVAPDADITAKQMSRQLVGGVQYSTAAGNPATYETLGSETRTSLIARRNVTVTSGTSPAPTASGTTCTTSSSLNWGEPLQSGTGTVPACVNYVPIIYSPGNLTLSGGRGQGVLIVDGSLSLSGNFRFVGLILVRDHVDFSGRPEIYGALMTRNLNGVANRLRGSVDLQYSRCAMSRSISGTGGPPTRLKDRAWANVY